MKIVFSIDQAAAIRRGIDAPSSTETLTIDPGTFTAEEREVIAQNLKDGFDCRSLPSATQPGLDGFKEVLALALAEKIKEAARQTQIKAKELAEALDAIRAYRAGHVTECKVGIDANGDPTIWQPIATRTVQVPRVPYVSAGERATKEYAECVQAAQQAEARIVAETLADMRRVELPAWTAAQEEAKAQEARDAETIMGLLSANQRERHAAGVLPPAEIAAVVRAHLLGTVRIAPRVELQWPDLCSGPVTAGRCDEVTLTAEQWEILQTVRKAARPGVTVDIVTRTYWRHVDDDDRTEDIEVDGDGDYVQRVTVLRETASGLGHEVTRFSGLPSGTETKDEKGDA